MPDPDVCTQPAVQGVVGLNSMAVYGVNFASAMPLNFQLAVGSNLALCINPTAFADLFGVAGAASTSVAQLSGSGLGGNMQLTLGNSTNFVIGQTYDINIGPDRVLVDVHGESNNWVKVWAIVLLTAAAAFEIVYGLLDTDDARAVCVGIYVVFTQVLLAFLMSAQGLANKADMNTHSEQSSAYQPSLQHEFTADVLTVVGDIAMVIGEIIALAGVSQGEARLDQSHNDALAAEGQQVTASVNEQQREQQQQQREDAEDRRLADLEDYNRSHP